jgi:Uma2 family endonuclease
MMASLLRGAPMSELAHHLPVEPIYPDSDGEPMAENTLQYEWIVTLKGGFDALLDDFVGGDLLWYPVRGEPKIRLAPDVLVALGRPKGYRGSYRQWEEGGVAPTLVIEVMSPSNTMLQMLEKHLFYQRHGVKEFIVYEPERGQLLVWSRTEQGLELVSRPDGWTSPSTGVRFELDGTVLIVTRPDGRCFESYQEVIDRAGRAEEQLGLTKEQLGQTKEQLDQTVTQLDEARTRAAEAEAENQRLLAELATLRAATGR